MLYRKGLRKILSLVLILCLTLSLAVTASAVHYNTQGKNGNNGNHFGNAARYMISEGYMKGDGNQNYYLSGFIKRGDIAVMIVRAFNLNSNAGGNHFGDVNHNDYYYDAINTAADLGIARGDGKNFLPRSYVTIQQAIWLIERAAGKAGIEVSEDLETLYDDEDLGNYATREDVCEMLYFVLTGSTDGFDGEFGSSHGWNAMTVSYEAEEDETVAFYGEDFADALEEVAEDETLSYVKFTSLPSSDFGVLYYDYDEDDSSNTEVEKGDEYDAGDLDDISFVPESGFSGTVRISFTAYTEEDNRYSGKITISVGDTDITAGVVTYTTDQDTALDFDGSDFISVCDTATDEDLSTVTFTSLPSSTIAGVLYLDYEEGEDSNTRIVKGTSYDVGDIDDITFVPKSTYTGTVTISYTGCTEDDTEYTGTVKITVDDDTDVADPIAYETDEDTAVAFEDEDFIDALYEIGTDETLSYVKFTTLPAATYGTLYYDYDEDADSNTGIVKGTSYDVGDIDDISFVPAANYSGTVTIAYMGYTEDGTEYAGTVQISVNEVDDVAEAITCDADVNEAVTFTLSAFRSACTDATGGTLNGVKFELPDGDDYGTLYYNYDEDDATHTLVSSAKTYYAGASPFLAKVTFVPVADYTGTVTISYTGTTSGGVAFTGTVEITFE